MAAGAAAASTILAGQRNAAVAVAPRQIREDDSVISQTEEDELRAIERNAHDPAVRTMGVYTEKAPQKKGKITKKPWYIIDPRTSRLIAYTDALSMVCAPTEPSRVMLHMDAFSGRNLAPLWRSCAALRHAACAH